MNEEETSKKKNPFEPSLFERVASAESKNIIFVPLKIISTDIMTTLRRLFLLMSIRAIDHA